MPNQQVTIDGKSKTVTKFTVILHVGSNPDVLQLYCAGGRFQHAKLEKDGYGVAVPVVAMEPHYLKYRQSVMEMG
jgi:hypothetical protein